jgi:hypothetical protein
MWQTAIRVSRSRLVRAAPEHVWSLLGSTTAWSLGLGADFAFDVPASLPDTGRLFISIGTAALGLGTTVFEVRDEDPGKMICVQDRGAQPIGTGTFILSAMPSSGGVTAEVVVKTTSSREDKVGAEMYWRRVLDDWLGALCAVIEGKAPWPTTVMPGITQRAFAELAPVSDSLVVSAHTLIAAPVDVVWQLIRAGGSGRDRALGMAGRVPGTPEGAVGEMLYAVRSRPDGHLNVAVALVRELVQERHLRWRRVGRPHDEMCFALAPDSGGTRLELTASRAAPRRTDTERVTASVTKTLASSIRWYKDASERLA